MELTRFDRLMNDLQNWRDADEADSMALSRNDIIEIIEGVKALRAKLESQRPRLVSGGRKGNAA